MDNGFDASILKLVEQYAACDKRSSAINEERKNIRDNAEKLGIPSLHFQHAVTRAKKMTKSERLSYDDNVEKIISIVEGKQAELWPEETKRGKKREEKAAEERGMKGVDPDTNPRSDPKSGGAGKAPRRGKKAAEAAAPAVAPAEVDLEQAIAETHAHEQAEGETFLASIDTGLTEH